MVGVWPWQGQSELTWSICAQHGQPLPLFTAAALQPPCLGPGSWYNTVRRGSQRFWEMSFNQPNGQISSSHEKNGSSLLSPNIFFCQSNWSNSEHFSASLKAISLSLYILSFSSPRSLISLFHRHIFLHARATGWSRKWKCVCSAASLSSWHFPRERKPLSLQQS